MKEAALYWNFRTRARQANEPLSTKRRVHSNVLVAVNYALISGVGKTNTELPDATISGAQLFLRSGLNCSSYQASTSLFPVKHASKSINPAHDLRLLICLSSLIQCDNWW